MVTGAWWRRRHASTTRRMLIQPEVWVLTPRSRRWVKSLVPVLVELQPNAEPPVCKILDYGKYKYQAQKRANEARKKQKIIEVKEIKLRPNIDQHDYQVKMKAVHKFLDGGDKVKVTLRFRGREMAHVELGADLLSRVRGDVDDFAKIESMPKMEGRQMTMVLAPK